MKTFLALAVALCTYRSAEDRTEQLAEADRIIVDLEHACDQLGELVDVPGSTDQQDWEPAVGPNADDERRRAVFGNWSTAINVAIERISKLLPEPSAEATLVARELSILRMCGTRAAGAKAPIGSAGAWWFEAGCSLRRLHVALVQAIVLAPTAAPAAV